MDGRYDRSVRIPVRIYGAKLELLYPGNFPEIGQGAIGELVLDEYSLVDPKDVARFQAEQDVVLVRAPATLLCAVTAEARRDENLRRWLVTENLYPGGHTTSVPVEITEDLVLNLRGSKKGRLRHCRCHIPALGRDAESLNHAYSLISFTFEPLRLSHGGNVFANFYYDNGEHWMEIGTLREHAEAGFEKEHFLRPKIGSRRVGRR